MKSKICLDMYLLTLIMLTMVGLGFAIGWYVQPAEESTPANEEYTEEVNLDGRIMHLSELMTP